MQLYSEWAVVPPPEEAVVRSIADELHVSFITASLLAARGYDTPQTARAFLQADMASLHAEASLPDMDKAVARIERALDEGETVGIYGDYDVDGQTSTALLLRGLRALGIEPRWYIPERVAEGYGLNREAIERLAAEGVTLLITVDCGSGAMAEITRAGELGMDVIITDHHEPGDKAPPATAFVNPKRADTIYPFRELAGVGVAWKLMQALWQARGRSGLSPFSLELAALGTVADVCPLVDENRVLVKEGLERMNRGTMPALTALADVSGVKSGEISAGRIAFGLAPRLNAAGRIGHAEAGVRLLLCDDYEEARVLAEKLDEENQRRRELEARIVEQAVTAVEEGDMLGDWVLVVAGEGWHPGVIGIVASRLVERYARPAIVIGFDGDTGTGSGRSIGPFDLHGGLATCEDLLVRYGGHQMAAGLTVHKDNVEALRRAINEYAGRILTPADLVPKTRVDAYVPLDDMSEDLARELDRLAPFGVGNPTPVFGAQDVLVIGARAVGRDSDHLKLSLKQASGEEVYEAMAFGSGTLLDAVPPGSEVHIAFDLRLGEWRGQPQLTLILKACQSPLTVAERQEALHSEPMSVEVGIVKELRGQPVPIVDRRQRAAVHPLARAAYLVPLADTGARTVVLVGPNEDAGALAGSIGHSLQIDVGVVERVSDALDERVVVVAPETMRLGTRGESMERGSPPSPSPWRGRGHLVVFGLPICENTWWSVLLQAAASSGWVIHLAYDTGGVEASVRTLGRRYPEADTLRILYRALLSLNARQGGAVPPPEHISSYMESNRIGLLSTEGIRHGLNVFQQLGLLRSEGGGLHIIPQGGRRVDVASSEIYNDGVRIQQKFAAYSRIALKASPADLIALAAERSPLDGFTFPHPGSAGFSQAGS